MLCRPGALLPADSWKASPLPCCIASAHVALAARDALVVAFVGGTTGGRRCTVVVGAVGSAGIVVQGAEVGRFCRFLVGCSAQGTVLGLAE